MKTGSILAGIVLTLALASLASAEDRVGIGFVGGVNRAAFDLPHEQDTTVDAITRLALGGVVDVGLGGPFALRMEPMYAQKGGAIRKVQAEGTNGRLETDMLELAVLLKLSLGERRVRPYLLAGPAVGARLSENLDVYLGDETYRGDVSPVVEPLDLGLAFGAGVSVPLRSVKGFVECRYTLGLVDRMKGGSVPVTGPAGTADMEFDGEEDRFEMRGLQVLAGLTFRPGRR